MVALPRQLVDAPICGSCGGPKTVPWRVHGKLALRCLPCERRWNRERAVRSRARAGAMSRDVRNRMLATTDALERIDGATKACMRCGEVRGVSMFPRAKVNADGLSRYCRPCERLRCKQRYDGRAALQRMALVLGAVVEAIRATHVEDEEERQLWEMWAADHLHAFGRWGIACE